MFPRRRPKTERTENDEPLVPHGLVWQAIDQREEPENIESKPLASVHPFPKEVREESPQANPAIPLDTKKHVGSAPIPFPRDLRIASTTDNDDTFECPRPVLAPPVRLAEPPELQRPNKMRLAARGAFTNLLRFASARRSDVVQLSNKFWEKGVLACRRATSDLSLAQTNAADCYRRAELKMRFVGRDVAFAKIHQGYSRGQAFSKEVKMWIMPWLASLVTSARLRAGRLGNGKIKLRLKLPTFPEHWTASRPREYVRQLPSQVWILLTRVRAEWILKRRSVVRGARVWSSLSMAGLCAVLTIGFTAEVRHYASESLPSRRVFREQTTQSNTVKPLHPTSQNPAVTHPRKKSAHPATAQRKLNAVHTHTKLVTRRSADDNYVARDTYVYYGERPSNSH